MPNYPLTPCFSKCGLWTGRVSITWVLVRNAETQASSQICWFRICILTRSLHEVHTSQGLRSAVPVLACFLLEPPPYFERCDGSWISNVVREQPVSSQHFRETFRSAPKDGMLCSLNRITAPGLAYNHPLYPGHSTRPSLIPPKVQGTQVHSALKNYAFYFNNLLLITYGLVLLR